MALTAGLVVVLQDVTKSPSDRRTHSTLHAGTPAEVAESSVSVATPAACGLMYRTLATVMATEMTPEAAARIMTVLSAETRAGLSGVAAEDAANERAYPVAVALALGRLTTAEAAAIVAELSPATRDAVSNAALDAAFVGMPCP